MRAILINPTEKRVEVIDTPAQLDDLYKLIETNIVQAVMIGPDIAIWIDEEGLLKEPTQPFFAFRGHEENPFCGNAVILGSRNGETRDCPLKVADVYDRVVWLDIELVGMETFEDEVEWMGEIMPRFGSKPIFRPKPKDDEGSKQ